jgi:hypothetical protein
MAVSLQAVCIKAHQPNVQYLRLLLLLQLLHPISGCPGCCCCCCCSLLLLLLLLQLLLLVLLQGRQTCTSCSQGWVC